MGVPTPWSQVPIQALQLTLCLAAISKPQPVCEVGAGGNGASCAALVCQDCHNKVPRTAGLNTGFALRGSGGWKCEIQLWARRVSSEASLLGVFSLCLPASRLPLLMRTPVGLG